jgi:hypothetical protein
MTYLQIRENYSTGNLTWGELLEITGLAPYDLFPILEDLID